MQSKTITVAMNLSAIEYQVGYEIAPTGESSILFKQDNGESCGMSVAEAELLISALRTAIHQLQER
jgi:hypothetical protein